MKATIKCWIFLAICLLGIRALAHDIKIEFFYRKNCSECQKAKRSLLTSVKQHPNAEHIIIVNKDLSDFKNYMELIRHQQSLNYNGNHRVFAVINNSILLAGSEAIGSELDTAITSAQETPAASKNTLTDKELLDLQFSKFSLIAVALAGLIDGINPCVFAGLVFFMSLLISLRITDRRL